MEIETRRLLLRPLRNEDAPAMAQALNNFNVSKNLARVKFPYSVEDASAFINLQRGFDPQTLVCAIAFRCAPDELIGVISYENETAEFGYWLRECCWGQRIMSEAAAALIRHAFTFGTIEVLNSGYWNPISGHLLWRLGFKDTGLKTIFSVAQKREMPVVKMSLTKARWLEQEKGRAA